MSENGHARPSPRDRIRSMQDLPVPARAYVGAVVAAAAVALVLRLPEAAFARPWLFLALILLSTITAAFKVELPLTPSASSISVSYAVNFLALLTLPPVETLLIALASAWSQCTFRMSRRNPLHRTIFSIATVVLAVDVAIRVYMALGGVPGDFTGGALTRARPVVGAVVTYFAFNTGLMAGVQVLTTDASAGATLRKFLWVAPSYVVGAGAAALAAWALAARGLWLLPLMAAPLYLVYLTYRVYVKRIDDERRHVQDMSDLHLATIEALALAIDAKDQLGHDHIRRVEVYSTGLASAMGMSDSEIQGVKTAALLHDIGKLAVPEHILVKPGPLTAEEFQKVRIHPQVGAEIIGRVPFPYPVAPIIRSHHERWDGRGYPDGLKGDNIPLGARILAVVDYFDAVTSDRSYSKKMSNTAAQELLRQEAGQALDPRVVDTFLRLFPALHASVERMKSSSMPTLPLDPSLGASATVAGEEAKGPSVFRNIALAHREIYALYEIAQTMGTSLGVADTMALISSKMANLVPFSACSLFVYTESTDSLRCRFATGTDAELLQRLVVPSGQGLQGWVARNRRPLVNARPEADVEVAAPSDSTSLQSALVCPLIFGERFIGTLAVYHTEAGAYRDDHRRLLDRVCEQAAAVIHNAIVFERTQADSLTDPLTGLPNTRFMFLHLTRELARAGRLESEVSLQVLDLDDFKEINDNYGHQVGDRALRDIAAALRGAIRPYDICVRYAGDEFIVLLPGCGREEAERKRVELQNAIERLVFEAQPGKRLKLRISIGAAVFPEDGRTYEALLGKADTRMYANKSQRKLALAAEREGQAVDVSEPLTPKSPADRA